MKRGELIERGIAAGITIAFMAFVRPDPDPPLAGVALVALLMYEFTRICASRIRRRKRNKRTRCSTKVSRDDIQRWADTRLYWPIKEVV